MTDSQEIMLPTQHARAALQLLARSPGLVEQVLEGSGLSAETLGTFRFSLPASALWRIADNLSGLFGPGWFLRLPVLWSIEVQSEFGMAVRSAPTLRVAIDVLERFAHVRWRMGRVVASRGANGVRLDFLPLLPLAPAHQAFLSSTAALNFQTTVRGVIGDDVQRLHYLFRGDPPEFEDGLRDLLEGSVAWGSERAGVVLPNDLLDRPSPLSNEQTFNAMVRSLREMAADRERARTMAGAVRGLLDSTIQGQLDARAAARRLRVSRRTLERRLKEEGTGFRELSDEALRRRLLALIRDPVLPLQAIAEQLGYSDASSLQRSSRRLFGKPLAALRRELAEQGA